MTKALSVVINKMEEHHGLLLGVGGKTLLGTSAPTAMSICELPFKLIPSYIVQFGSQLFIRIMDGG